MNIQSSKCEQVVIGFLSGKSVRILAEDMNLTIRDTERILRSVLREVVKDIAYA